MEIDLASLFAGVSVTAVAGWLGSFFAFRKDERAVFIKQITEERTKWRYEMRKLTQDIVEIYSIQNIIPPREKTQSLRAKLETSTNPKCVYDKKILEIFDSLADKDDCLEFTSIMSLLLKHDWERVKWECLPFYEKIYSYVFKRKNIDWKQSDYRPALKVED
jgi:hypothetical protein